MQKTCLQSQTKSQTEERTIWEIPSPAESYWEKESGFWEKKSDFFLLWYDFCEFIHDSIHTSKAIYKLAVLIKFGVLKTSKQRKQEHMELKENRCARIEKLEG